MRIVTWNCNLRLSKKLDRLLGLNPDVAVIQECEQALTCPPGYYYTWCGNDPIKGLGVLSRGEPLMSNQPTEWNGRTSFP